MTPETIKSAVADYFNLPVLAIDSKSRKKELVKARHMAMNCFLLLTDFSLSHIGKEFGKHHCAVIHARKSVNNQAYYNRGYRSELRDVLCKLGFYNMEYSKYEQYETDKT